MKGKPNHSAFLFRNLTRSVIPESVLAQIGERALRILKFSPETTVSVVFLGEDRMRTLNRTWRKKNRPTTVLAFLLREKNGPDLFTASCGEIGEVVLCPAYIRRKIRAAPDSSIFSRELAKLFVHGIVHLAGFTHERSARDARRMEDEEVLILTAAARKAP